METGAGINESSNSQLLTNSMSQKFFLPRKKSLSIAKRLRLYIFPSNIYFKI